MHRHSCVQLFVTLWTISYQAPLSMEFFRQEQWNGLPFPSPSNTSSKSWFCFFFRSCSIFSGVTLRSKYVVQHKTILFSQLHLLKTVLFYLTIYECLFQGSVPLVYLSLKSLYLWQLSFEINFESSKCFVLFQDCFDYLVGVL